MRRKIERMQRSGIGAVGWDLPSLLLPSIRLNTRLTYFNDNQVDLQLFRWSTAGTVRGGPANHMVVVRSGFIRWCLNLCLELAHTHPRVADTIGKNAAATHAGVVSFIDL